MTHYDVFNGDADGICALQQLRLSSPKESTMITGVKRDIQLLNKISGNDSDSVTVLDISLDKNRTDLIRLLNKNVVVDYFDHHYAGEIPSNQILKTHIDTTADTCTSLIVDQFLSGAHTLWAIVGAYGDNLDNKADHLADSLMLDSTEKEKLKKLGILINYNAYGTAENDLHFKPNYLAKMIRPFTNPLEFISNSEITEKLHEGYNSDMTKAKSVLPTIATDKIALYILPNEPWARRISGVYSNLLCKSHSKRAHALLTMIKEDAYLVSVRAPNSSKTGADDLCRKFPSGGGRKAAAGINNLPFTEYENFIIKFRSQFD